MKPPETANHSQRNSSDTRRITREGWFYKRLKRNLESIYRFTFGERLTLSFLAVSFFPIAILSILAIYFNSEFIQWSTRNEMRLVGEKAAFCIESGIERWLVDSQNIASVYAQQPHKLDEIVAALPSLVAVQLRKGEDVSTVTRRGEFQDLPFVEEGIFLYKGEGAWLLAISATADNVKLNFIYDLSHLLARAVAPTPHPYSLRIIAGSNYLLHENPLQIGMPTQAVEYFDDAFFAAAFLPYLAYSDESPVFVTTEKGVLPISKTVVYSILVGAGSNFLAQKVVSFRSQLASFVLLAFMLVLVFSMVFSKLIVMPVGKAAEQAKALEVVPKKVFKQIEYPNDDEIGDLVKEINKLGVFFIQTVEQHDSAKSNLENEIQDITRQLKNALNEIANINRDLKNKVDKQAEMLVQAEKKAILANLVQGLTHNLKNPVASLLGYLQLLGVNNLEKLKRLKSMPDPYRSRETAMIEEEQQWIAIMIESCSRLMEIVNSILDRAYARELPSKIVIDLNELVRKEIVFLESDLFFKHQIEKHFDLQVGIPAVFATYSDISQVVGNLLQNAREAMEDTQVKRLGIATRLKDDFVCLTISDTGIGIPDDVKPRIFEPYFSTKAGKSLIGGSGLGLSTSAEILRRYNGKLEFESTVGKGTSFTIVLPAFKDSIDE